jgi:hypothetical protein
VGSLDRAFLSVLGSMTLAFSFLQILLERGVAVVVFFPFLLSGLVCAFYSGCLKGAVERTSWRESMLWRVKGWLYLFVGGVSYATMTVISILRDLPELAGYMIYMYFVVVSLGTVLCYRGIRWVRIVTETLQVSDGVVIGASCGAAIFLSMAAYLVEELARLFLFPQFRPEWIQTADLFARFAPLSSLFLLLFFLTERVAIALSAPGTDLEWQAALVNEMLYEDAGENRRARRYSLLGGVRFYAGKFMWMVGDSAICLYVGWLSNGVAAWLTILSVAFYFEVHLLYLVRSAVGISLAALSSLLTLFTIRIYSKTSADEIRTTYPKSRDELLTRYRRILDC